MSSAKYHSRGSRPADQPTELAASGWLKPTDPPIRAASQTIMPKLPPAPQQPAGGVKPILLSAADKSKH